MDKLCYNVAWIGSDCIRGCNRTESEVEIWEHCSFGKEFQLALLRSNVNRPAASPWQTGPAPKDGRKILGFFKTIVQNSIKVVWWRKEGWYSETVFINSKLVAGKYYVQDPATWAEIFEPTNKSQEVKMKGKIDKKGQFYLKRKWIWVEQICPFAIDSSDAIYCGHWCPLFDEIEDAEAENNIVKLGCNKRDFSFHTITEDERIEG